MSNKSQNNYQYYVVGLLAGFLWLGALPAHAGTLSGGGGGTSVQPDGLAQPVLLDFYVADLGRTPSAEPAGESVRPTRFLDVMPIEPFSDEEAKAIALGRITTWSERLPELSSALKEIVSQTMLVGTNHQLKKFSKFFTPKSAPTGDALRSKTVILYDNIFGPIVFLDDWNALGRTSRAGMIVHEALRQLWNVNPGSLSERNLETLTAMILLRAPDEVSANDVALVVGSELGTALANLPLGPGSSRRLKARLYLDLKDQIVPQLRALARDSGNAGLAAFFSEWDQTFDYYHSEMSAGLVTVGTRKISSLFCSARGSAGGNSQMREWISRLCLEDGAAGVHWTEDQFGPKSMRRLYSDVARALGQPGLLSGYEHHLDDLQEFVLHPERTHPEDRAAMSFDVSKVSEVLMRYFNRTTFNP